MSDVFQFFELWTKLEAAGGTRLGFFKPIKPTRRRRLNGDDALAFGIPKTHRLALLMEKGKAIREVLSLDGTSYREWIVDTYAWGSGTDLVMAVTCLPPLVLLANYPVATSDADGYVYSDTGAIQLSPSTIITSFIRSNTPSYIGTGTVTPTAVAEVPFSGDSALSGLRRMEDLIPGYEASLQRNGTTAYDVTFSVLGSGATTLYLRTAKNLKSLRKDVQPGQVTRVNQVAGGNGDDGPSGLAWAYWEVVSTAGAGPFTVVLKAIHGGAGPIAYDNQLNHSGLPGGANSLYLEKRDGTFTQITGSTASTQTVTVASITTVTAGDWVRIVASSTGKHLTSLDAPTELAATGILGGRFESAWDDTVCVVKNALQEDWTATLPTGWTAASGAAKTTAANQWVSSGAALSINQSVTFGAIIAAPPSRTWYIRARRTTYSAVAWIRLRSALTTGGTVRFQVRVGGLVLGFLDYVSPINAWRQLKIEGLDLSAYVGTSVSITAELIPAGTIGATTVDMLVDSICVGPSLAARAVTTGSNAARIWQGVAGFLEDKRTAQVSYGVNAADLARMGRANQVDVTLGGTAIVVDDELGTVTGRVVEISDAPDDPRDATYVISTLPARLSRTPSKPLGLIIPFFEPIAVRVASRDTRNAAITVKASVAATDATTVTISVVATDTLGGTPTITAAAFGATYVSGLYIYARPSAGSGTGRVVFTATLPGRTDVWDAVDIPEQTPAPPTMVVTTTPGTSTYSIVWSTNGTMTVSIDGAAYGTPAASPISVTRPAFGLAAKVYSFKATLNGIDQTDTVTIPAAEVAAGPSLVVKVAAGSTSDVITYTATGTLTVSINGAAYAAAAASPITVTKPAAGLNDTTYDFKCVGADATEVSANVRVQALVSAVSVLPVITYFYISALNNTTNEMTTEWSVVNAPSGGSYTLQWWGPNETAWTDIASVSSTYAFTSHAYDVVAKGTAGSVRNDMKIRLRVLDSGSVLKVLGESGITFSYMP